MKLLVMAVGHRMPSWINAGFQDYAHRMPRAMPLRLVEIKPEPRSHAVAGGRGVARWLEAERKRIEAALPPQCYRIALDERGAPYATHELSTMLAQWRMAGRDVAFMIGGADGLAAGLREEADLLWSLSSLTLPHGLVRVIVAEQLYRAASMLSGHPYHRA